MISRLYDCERIHCIEFDNVSNNGLKNIVTITKINTL